MYKKHRTFQTEVNLHIRCLFSSSAK